MPTMSTPPAKHRPKLFKWRHFEPDITLLCVRWYLRVRHITGY